MATHQENELEKILQLAADEPAHRPEFYRVLLDSTIYILGSAGQGEGDMTLAAGGEVHIEHWKRDDGSVAIPFFSSLAVLQESIDSERSYLALPAKSLFEMTAGAYLLLNPKTPYGKEFTPGEVQELLTVGVNRGPVPHTTGKKARVLLGQPATYPTRMIDSLSKLLIKHRNVTRAFLALMDDTSTDEGPSLVVGIEAKGNIAMVMREVGNVAADTVPNNEVVDLYHVREGSDGLSDYLLTQTTPFYERA